MSGLPISDFRKWRSGLELPEDLVSKRGNGFTEEVQLLITDIEMPQMDGHH